MAFSEAFLDDLRARVPVSEIAARKVQLKKRGSEFVGLSPINKEKTESFTVNDSKGMWHDFSAGKGGDVFGFLQDIEGYSFPEAVKIVAEVAGVDVPDAARTNGHAEPRRVSGATDGPLGEDPPSADGPDVSGGAGVGRNTAREITKTYDYTDASGSLIYQVCRLEWDDNGKRKKTFMQRRPTPDGASWIWGLSGGEFLKGRNGEWYQATKDRIEKWKGAERQTFPEGAQHGLYRLVEFNELKSGGSEVWIAEGEKDVDTLTDWGLVATTNSGGARNWRPDHAEMFRGLDVVIPIDNDSAGHDRANIIAQSLRGIARRVRVLDFAKVWTDAPKGADVTDWKRQREGDRDELLQILESLPEWVPPPFQSKFGLVMWGEHNEPGEQYDYLIEDLIPEREAVLIQGESQSGKSFKTQAMAMSGARGVHFFDRRVLEPFGVVYCAYEAGKGFRNRMRAYERAYNLDPGERYPFAVLTKPVDLWSAEVNTQMLTDEIIKIAETQFNGVRLGAVVIDTHNRANPGASEIESKDVSRIIDRYSFIMDKTKAGIWIIGHKNAAGKHRGNEQLYNNIETVIDISREYEPREKERVELRDGEGHVLRRAKVIKQREGIDGQSWLFVLPTVEVGTNKYGKARSSCYASKPIFHDGDDRAQNSPTKPKDRGIRLTHERALILAALRDAISEVGEPTPTKLKLPRAIKSVVKSRLWKQFYLQKCGEEAPPTDDKVAFKVWDDKINKRLRDASTQFLNLRLIGRVNPYVWLTSRAAGPVTVEAVVHEGMPTGDLVSEAERMSD